MGHLIQLSIDLDKIDKDRIFTAKSGKKYYSLTVSVNDEANQYGSNVSAWSAQSKEERDAKKDRVFCANGKVVWTDGKPLTIPDNEKPSSEPDTFVADGDDDLPF